MFEECLYFSVAISMDGAALCHYIFRAQIAWSAEQMKISLL